MTGQTDPTQTFKNAILAQNIEIDIQEHDRNKLPGEGPFLCIANQSIEGIDELVLMSLMGDAGVNFRIIGQQKKVSEALQRYFLPVQTGLIQGEDYIKQVYKHLSEAKNKRLTICLVLHFTDKSLDTPVRNQFLNQLMKAILRVGLPIVPIRIKAPFPGFVRPSIGKRLIQKNRKDPYRITVRVGKAIPIADQQKFPKPKDFRRFIQSKIFSLGSGLEIKPLYLKNIFKRPEQTEPIAPPIHPQIIAEEINQVKTQSLIASKAEFDILVVEAKDIPNTLKEIGRLREVTFRSVEEGTGKSLDLDEYDLYYHQLILWDREAQQIAGGYRMGIGDEIFSRYGPEGFYISSLFKIADGFYPIMQSAVELGRSYIVPEYQKKRMPLFLLWKGILFFLLKNPQYRYLYGPVSISKYYSNISRSLIVTFIRNYYFNHQLAQYLKPRKPFQPKIDRVDVDVLASTLGDQIKNLDNLIEDIEPEHIRIPVLVRQYLKLNARFISFNVDPNFSDVLDGFIILDLQDVPESMIEALKREA